MKLKVALLVTVVAALAPAGAGAATLHGVVIAKSHGTLLVAGPSGLVQSVRGNAAIGARLSGTAVVGHASRVRIHGVVVKQLGTTTILSSNHHLVAIHSRRAAAVGGSVQPGTGSVVDATVGVGSNGELDEQDEQTVGQVNGALQVQATITAVGVGTVTLSVNGQSFTVDLPAGLTLNAAVVGQTVTLNVEVGNQGDDQGDDQGGDNGGGDD